MLKIKVTREPIFRAPRPPLAIQCHNISYCATSGGKMVMSRVGVDTKGLLSEEWMKMVDNNQRFVSRDCGHTWKEQGPVVPSGPYESGQLRTSWMHFLDPDNGLMIALFAKSTHHNRITEGKLTGYFREKNTKVYYEISRDQGETWSPAKQVIHPGKEYDSEHWMPGITSGQEEATADMAPFAKLDDGTIVSGFSAEKASYPAAVFLRGRWNKERSDLTWDMGEKITAPETVGDEASEPDMAGYGVCEPDLVHLGGQRLFTTLRCGSVKSKGIYASRQCATSDDGGLTWSKPKPLSYDDGTPVYVPESFATFERHPQTGRVFWFANILDRPVYGGAPRYPLAMAELDTKRLCLLKDSVTVVQDRPKGYPETRYSNFGHYVDRETGEIVILIEEEFWFTGKFRTNYQTDDYCSHRIKLS